MLHTNTFRHCWFDSKFISRYVMDTKNFYTVVSLGNKKKRVNIYDE